MGASWNGGTQNHGSSTPPLRTQAGKQLAVWDWFLARFGLNNEPKHHSPIRFYCFLYGFYCSSRKPQLSPYEGLTNPLLRVYWNSWDVFLRRSYCSCPPWPHVANQWVYFMQNPTNNVMFFGCPDDANVQIYVDTYYKYLPKYVSICKSMIILWKYL